jgi:hypothetical protein
MRGNKGFGLREEVTFFPKECKIEIDFDFYKPAAGVLAPALYG